MKISDIVAACPAWCETFPRTEGHYWVRGGGPQRLTLCVWVDRNGTVWSCNCGSRSPCDISRFGKVLWMRVPEPEFLEDLIGFLIEELDKEN